MGFWEIKLDGWTPMEVEVSKAAAQALARGETEYRFSSRGQSYLLDFRGMVQVNLKTTKTRPIREVRRSGSPVSEGPGKGAAPKGHGKGARPYGKGHGKGSEAAAAAIPVDMPAPKGHGKGPEAAAAIPVAMPVDMPAPKGHGKGSEAAAADMPVDMPVDMPAPKGDGKGIPVSPRSEKGHGTPVDIPAYPELERPVHMHLPPSAPVMPEPDVPLPSAPAYVPTPAPEPAPAVSAAVPPATTPAAPAAAKASKKKGGGFKAGLCGGAALVTAAVGIGAATGVLDVDEVGDAFADAGAAIGEWTEGAVETIGEAF